jgi:hypothetical protein
VARASRLDRAERRIGRVGGIGRWRDVDTPGLGAQGVGGFRTGLPRGDALFGHEQVGAFSDHDAEPDGGHEL